MNRDDLLAQGYVSRGANDRNLSKEEYQAFNAAVPEWNVVVENDVDKLVRKYQFKDFVAALEFTTRLGLLAEEVGHHPIIQLQWGKVSVEWWTHEIVGLHQNDFIMAARSDLAYEDMDA